MKEFNQIAALSTMIDDALTARFDGLSPRAAAVLFSLLSRGGMGVSFLAEVVGVAQPTASRLIDGLVRQGFVTRGDKDGKAVTVSLTKTGRIKAEDLRQGRDDVVRTLCSGLSQSETEQLGSLVAKVLSKGTRDRGHARTTCRYYHHDICIRAGCPVDRKATMVETAAMKEPKP